MSEDTKEVKFTTYMCVRSPYMTVPIEVNGRMLDIQFKDGSVTLDEVKTAAMDQLLLTCEAIAQIVNKADRSYADRLVNSAMMHSPVTSVRGAAMGSYEQVNLSTYGAAELTPTQSNTNLMPDIMQLGQSVITPFQEAAVSEGAVKQAKRAELDFGALLNSDEQSGEVAIEPTVKSRK